MDKAAAATLLARVGRGRLGRARARAMRAELRLALLHRAATAIARSARGFVARAQLSRVVQQRRPCEPSEVLQAIARGFLCRVALRRLRARAASAHAEEPLESTKELVLKALAVSGVIADANTWQAMSFQQLVQKLADQILSADTRGEQQLATSYAGAQETEQEIGSLNEQAVLQATRVRDLVDPSSMAKSDPIQQLCRMLADLQADVATMDAVAELVAEWASSQKAAGADAAKQLVSDDNVGPGSIRPLALAGLATLVGEGAAAAQPAEQVISSPGTACGPDSDAQHDAPKPKIEATGNVRAELPTGITPLAVAGLAALVGEGFAARTDRTDASTDRMLCSVLEAAKAEAAKAHILRAQAA